MIDDRKKKFLVRETDGNNIHQFNQIQCSTLPPSAANLFVAFVVCGGVSQLRYENAKRILSMKSEIPLSGFAFYGEQDLDINKLLSVL